MSTETKAFSKTSEFGAYVVAVVGVLIAANSIDANDGNDYFTADRAWLFITVLTVGYMLSQVGQPRALHRGPVPANRLVEGPLRRGAARPSGWRLSRVG